MSRPAPRDPAAPPPPDRVAQAVGAALIALAVVVLASRLVDPDVRHIIWLDRELFRAQRALSEFPLAGAEMNHGVGARVPGGAWYHLIAIPVLLGAGAVGVYQVLLAMEVVAAALLGALGWRAFGPLAGGVAALAWLAPAKARLALGWLWNPTALPLFVVGWLALTARALRTGARSAWFGAALLLALAAQIHLTALSWMVWTGLALLVVRPDAARRAAPWTGLAVLVAYAHHVVGEALTGWPNTRALSEQGPIRGARHGHVAELNLDELGGASAWLLPDPAEGGWVLTLVVGAGVLAGLVHAVRGPQGPARDLLRIAGAGLVATVLQIGLSPGVQLEWRYLLIALPTASLLTGVGWWRLLGAIPVAPARHALTLGVAAVLAVGPVRELTDRRPEEPGLTSWRGLVSLVDHLAPTLGGSRADVTGRLALVRYEDGAWHPMQDAPIDHLLDREGASFPGSGDPPCAIAFQRRPGDPEPGADTLAEVFARDPDDITVRSREERLGADVLVYDLARGRCPTTMVNRYVLTPEERTLRPLWLTLGPGEVDDQRLADGTRRLVTKVARPARDGSADHEALLALDLQPRPSGLDVVLRSSQLRGPAYNDGWFQPGLADDVVLVLTGADGLRHEVSISDEPVGLSHVVTPLHATGAVPPGRYAASLRATLYPVPPRFRDWTDLLTDPVDVDVSLADDVVIPE